MPKKYKHIKLPSQLAGSANSHILGSHPNPQGLLPLTDAQNNSRKTRISAGLAKVEQYEREVEQASDLNQEGYYELKVSLRRGGNKELLKRLNIEPYRKRDITHEVLENGEKKTYKEEIVLGRISTTKLRGERLSNYDKLRNELDNYIEHNALYSYYDTINDIKPLTLDEVAEEGLVEELRDMSDDKSLLVDLVFADTVENSEAKMSSLESHYGTALLVKVNTELSHYCRMSLTKQEIEEIVKKYKGIIELTHAPVFVTSEGQVVESQNITPTDQTSDDPNPIIVADQAIADSHPLLTDVLVDRIGDTTRIGNHGTQVGSLVVYGKKIPLHGSAEQKNKIMGLTALLKDPLTGNITINETLIQDTVEAYSSARRALIINLSINNTFTLYDRSSVSHLTVFLDELAYKHNCIFVISAGNMNEINDFYAAGIPYPDYFDEDHTTILAPADSINNLTVGAITYQESADSIARLENPSPITRRGFEERKFGFIKPDLVHFDSNCVLENNIVKPEYNGPNLATENTGITKNIGTSFATPLVSHELGLLAGYYPSYKAQTLKALLVHFSQMPNNLPSSMQPERVVSLLGHGQTRIEDAINSLNTASTMVLEDSIKIKTTKPVAIPVPNAIAGTRNLRLRIRVTLAYSPKPNNTDVSCYCPINISAHIERDDNRTLNSSTTQSYLNGAHKKSNLKKYPAVDKSTVDHMGTFWNVVLTADPIGDSLPDDYEQPYSMIVTIEDIEKDDSLDIHEEISQMIEVRTNIAIDIEV